MPADRADRPSLELPPELKLILACAEWPQSGAASARVRELLSEKIDWRRVMMLAAHHRLLPLLARGLGVASTQVPEEIRHELRATARRTAQGALEHLRLASRLSDALTDAGVRVCVLKGVPLSAQAFDDVTLREVGDLDLLVRPGDLERAQAVLAKERFTRSVPSCRMTPRRLSWYRLHEKSFTYAAESTSFEVDLHWRLFRSESLAANQLASADSGIPQTIGTVTLLTMPPLTTFIYLCLHGTLEGWWRLRALVDVAALWRRFDAGERTAVLAKARQCEAVAEVAAGLLLAEAVQVLDSEEISPALRLHEGDAIVSTVMRYAVGNLFAANFMPTSLGAGSWAIKRYELSLRASPRYKLQILRRVLFRPRIWETIDLPDWLFPLYGLLSPLEWLSFHSKGRVPRIARQRARSSWLSECRKWMQLGPQERALLWEAMLFLLLARLALRLAPFRWIRAWLERPMRSAAGPHRPAIVEEVRRAVLRVARRSPLHLSCFPQALAAQAMLHRRRVSSRVLYGVRRDANARLRAHTWLKVGEETVLGGAEAPMFAVLSEWSKTRKT